MNKCSANLIYLTGFMGSGKSTIAPLLANTLGYSFMDIDREIENKFGKKINKIFQDHGEKNFRETEHKLLIESSRLKECVVSLGGGTIANDSNLKIVKTSGILIYLKTDIRQIFQRLKNKTDRPLMKSKEGEQLTEEEIYNRIVTLLEFRTPYYNQADITIPTDISRVGLTVDEIVRRIRQFNKRYP